MNEGLIFALGMSTAFSLMSIAKSVGKWLGRRDFRRLQEAEHASQTGGKSDASR